MPVDAPTRRVINAYRLRTDRLRQQLVRYLTATWGALDDYRAADIASLVEAVVPVVEGGLGQMAAMTDAYLATIESIATGEPTAPVGVDRLTTETLRGTPASEVYTRPGTTVWTALSEGKAFPDAWQQGLDRLLSLGTTDLQLAKTHTSRSILAGKDDVIVYRRVLEGPKSCGMCIVASTQRYHKGDLMPIHGGCDCSVLPIYGADPKQRILEPDLLDDVRDRLDERGLYDQTRKTGDDIPRYQDVIVVHEHGELGPVLTRKGDEFTGPSDL
jgi:hypothetical protein